MSFNRTAGTLNVVTLSEAKKQLVVTSSDDENYILGLIKAAVLEAEDYIERSVNDNTCVLKLDKFPYEEIKLSYGPVRSLSSLTYYDSDNTEQTLVEGTDFYLDKDSKIARLVKINSWPDTYDIPNAVTVTYKAGYIDDATDPPGVNLPESIKQAVLLRVADLYEVRSGIIVGSQVNQVETWKILLNPHKVYWYAEQ